MNSLLPFGEYVSPAQRAAEQASLETWELERLLIRLAASQREQRHHRSSRHGGSSSQHRRQGSRGEASAPQPIRGSGGAAVAPEAVTAAWWSLPPSAAAGPAVASSASSSATAGAGISGRELRAVSNPIGVYPSSWPPAGGPEASHSGDGAAGDEGHVVSPRSRAGAMSFKGRLASLRLK